LTGAAKQISDTSHQLIEAAKSVAQAQKDEEEKIDWSSMGVVEKKKKEMDVQVSVVVVGVVALVKAECSSVHVVLPFQKQVEILRLEKELQGKRSMLARLREQQYKK
jgi:sensor histidine kinase regulating citrate/malate metabolism